MGVVFYILLGWLLTIGACYGTGSLLLAWLRISSTREEAVPLRFVAGAGVYAMVVFAFGILHLYHRPVFVLTPLLIGAWAYRAGTWRLPAERLPPLTLWQRRAAWVAAPFAIYYFANAMAPEVSPDGSSYHLGLIARYYRERAMIPVTSNFYSALSQGIEMLFLSAYAVGRHSAAGLVHFTFLLALPWLMLCYGRRYGMATAGVAAALFFFCSPVVGIDGISAYNDVAAATVLFALFVVLRRYQDDPGHRGLLILGGVLGGFAFAIKYTLFPALLFAATWILWIHRSRALRPLITLGIAATPMAIPWLIRNLIWWRNPLAPFFNHWFPNPYVLQSFESEYRGHLKMYSLQSRWQIPWEVTIAGADLNGLLGPLFLLAPLALLALRNPEGRRLLLAAGFFLSTYFSNIGTRFLIPPLPFVAFGLAIAFGQIPRAALSIALIHALVSWPGLAGLYASPWAWRLDKFPWRQALRIKPEEEFIRSRLTGYDLARSIEREVPAGLRVLGFNQLPEAYTNRDYLVAFQSAEGQALRDVLYLPMMVHRQPANLIRLEFPSEKAQAIRVIQDTGGASWWSVAEMRLYGGAGEITRDKRWQLRSNPPSESVQAAFDNSLVTRWYGDGARRGMYLEVKFGREEEVDQVQLQLSGEHPWDCYRVEVLTSEGTWVPRQVKAVEEKVLLPGGLRRAAVEELLRRGIHYIAIETKDFGCGDLVMNREYWGVELVDQKYTSHLLRLMPRSEFEGRLKHGKSR